MELSPVLELTVSMACAQPPVVAAVAVAVAVAVVDHSAKTDAEFPESR